jgi:twitching motility protein PilT
VRQNKTSVIVHREVGEPTRTFADALTGAMRHDPDILLLGGMRELDTIKLTLSGASMGMLIFGPLHTHIALRTVARIINAFPANEQNQVRVMLVRCLARGWRNCSASGSPRATARCTRFCCSMRRCPTRSAASDQ